MQREGRKHGDKGRVEEGDVEDIIFFGGDKEKRKIKGNLSTFWRIFFRWACWEGNTGLLGVAIKLHYKQNSISKKCTTDESTD